MKTAPFYVVTHCEYCLNEWHRKGAPGDGPFEAKWVESWLHYKTAFSPHIEDPRGRCVGCRTVRMNSARVMANLLAKLKIEVKLIGWTHTI